MKEFLSSMFGMIASLSIFWVILIFIMSVATWTEPPVLLSKVQCADESVRGIISGLVALITLRLADDIWEEMHGKQKPKDSV